jgi:hypothetical protein
MPIYLPGAPTEYDLAATQSRLVDQKIKLKQMEAT